jgi:hypothetical protein
MNDVKIGGWCEYEGCRYLVFNTRIPNISCVNEHGDVGFIKPSEATYLPDCTGWDWQPPQPIDPGEGYRLIDPEVDTWQEGDEYKGSAKWWTSFAGNYSKDYTYRRKIEPQYRPFANAEEFKPYRDKWVIAKHSGYESGYAGRIDVYLDEGVYSVKNNIARVESWKHAFDALLFEDGTPFGVKL